MNKLIAIALSTLFASSVALAQAPAKADAAKPATAATPATPAKPAEPAKPAAKPDAVKPGPGPANCDKPMSKDGKELHGAAKAAVMAKCKRENAGPAGGKMDQKNKMKKCSMDAKGKKGAEHKAFMKECLSK